MRTEARLSLPGNFLQHKLLDNALSLRHEALNWPLWSQVKTQLEGVWDCEKNVVHTKNCHSALQVSKNKTPDDVRE